jgi:hypothetical protein
MENMRRSTERRRKTRALSRNRPHRKYRGAKKAAHEKLERRNRPGALSTDKVPTAARASEMSVAAHAAARALETMRIAGEILLPKTVTLSP